MEEHSADLALTRLEDVLLGLSFERALPDLDTILSEAGVTSELLLADDRALKLLHEAVVARPLSDRDEVASLTTTVELLTLEVRVLSERIADPSSDLASVRAASARLSIVRSDLERIRDLL